MLVSEGCGAAAAAMAAVTVAASAAEVAAVAVAAEAIGNTCVRAYKEPKKQRCAAIRHMGIPFLKVVFLFEVVASDRYRTQIVYITKHYICIWSIL